MAVFGDFVRSQFLEKVSLSCAYCIHSVVRNSQVFEKDICVLVWKQHTTGDDTTQGGSSV